MNKPILSKKQRRLLSKLPPQTTSEIPPEIPTITEKPEKAWPEYVFLKGEAFNSRNFQKDPNITISDLDLYIGGKTLLKDTSLSLQFKQKYGLVGKNGIGKSVLLKTLANREGPFTQLPMGYTVFMVEQEIMGNDHLF